MSARARTQRRRPIGGLASLVREAREQAGLSQRQLAEVMGSSWVTVNAAEKGRDVRSSTLAAYLRALPDLSAAELLEAPAVRPASLDTSWEWYRDLFGFSARTLRKDVVVHENGDVTTSIEALGIRALRGDLRDHVLRTALQRAVCLGASGLVRRIESTAADLVSGRADYRDGAVVHEFVMPRDLRRRGMTYRLRQLKRGLFEAGTRSELASTSAQGSSLSVGYPVERLELSVAFRGRGAIEGVRAHAWPNTVVPQHADARLLALFAEQGRLRLSHRSRRLLLAVERPLIDLHYGVAWERL